MIIGVSTDDQIAIVEDLAREIWTEHYTPIIGKEQVCYMLDRFQSKGAISAQIKDEGFRYFLIGEEGRYIGYLGVLTRGEELFLSKIYVRSSERNKGFGKKAVQFLEDLARRQNLQKISLTVNKNNTGSVQAYEKMGFKNLGPVVQDIGKGFIMDDFRMEKRIG